MIQQHSHAARSHEKRQAEPSGESLSTKERDLQQSNENRDGSQNDRGNTGRYALLGPEEAAVVDQEDERAKQRGSGPLPPVRRRRAPKTHPAVQRQTGNAKAKGREQEWRYLLHADTDGQERRPPDEVDDGERQNNLP
jgi:hypothetical protein